MRLKLLQSAAASGVLGQLLGWQQGGISDLTKATPIATTPSQHLPHAFFAHSLLLPPQLQPQPRQRRCPFKTRRRSNLSSRCFGCRLQRFRSDRRVVEQVSISGWDRQSPSDYNSTTNLLNGLNLPAPTRGTVVKVTGNGVPGAVGQGCRALLPGLEVPRINGAR